MNEVSNRHEITKDQLFWTKLAFTACGLLREEDDKTLRGFWIDDFMPEDATDTKRGVDVKGTAWVGDGSRAMYPYRFIVSVPQKMLHRRRDSFSIESFILDREQQTVQVEIGNENHVG